MKKYLELTIEVESLSESESIEAIADSLSECWDRIPNRNVDLVIPLGGTLYGFEFKSSKNHAKLYVKKEAQGIRVTNIVPIDKSELSHDEYNNILRQFISEAIEGRFKYHLSKENVEIADLLSKDSIDLFKSFAISANKSTGISHPVDALRWMDFLYSTVKRGETDFSEDIQFFLVEEGWSEQSAYNLSLDYSYGTRVMLYTLSVI